MTVWDFILNAWRPAVEILILAVLVYYPLMYVRGTRGWPIVLGFLVVLLALSAVTVVLNLDVLRWLLRYFLTGFALAVLIIFQPELRRIFAELGRKPLFATAHERRQNIEIIIQAAERLSEMRIGALMALERSTELDDFVESGIVVDCEATPEMLETIFFPNNAVHDGGVIIRGDRILKAACIFPLTQRQDLSKSLGTRHRAAIGLSEETDAVVVAVSEETGAVSYTCRGQLVHGISREELRSFLTSVFVPAEDTTSWTAAWLRLMNRLRAIAARRTGSTPPPEANS
jgi:diadenylate cyclase